MSIVRIAQEMAVLVLVFVCVAVAGNSLAMPFLDALPVTREYDILFDIVVFVVAAILVGVLHVTYRFIQTPQPRSETFEEMERRVRSTK